MTDQPDVPWIRPPATVRTLIVGAGRAGQALARDLRENGNHGLRPVGFIDDAPPEPLGRLPLPFLGTLADTEHLVTEHAAEAVVLAVPCLPPTRTRELTRAAVDAGAIVRYLPWYTASLCRDVTAADLRALDVRALVDGPDPHVVSPEVKEIVTGKRILVTGTDQPIGSELCRQLNAFNPDELHLLDSAEAGDRHRTDHALRELRPEVVFHTAGLRHASVLERRPSLGVKANVEPTDNLVRAAARHGAERFILVSADADPASVLGATQRVAEAIVRVAPHKSARQGAETVFATVRVGDVLDARDSLLTVLPDQIRAGGPVALTHPDATRSFATVEEAVALALEAGWMATGGETYVLDLGEPMRVTDVISRFTRQYKLPEVPIRYAGPRQKESPRPADRLPTAHPQIYLPATEPDPTDHEHLHERLDKLYKAAAKNRDPKVRQLLRKLAESMA